MVPFKSLKGFAQRVAAGELDTPLAMDRRNVFGAFTESFDLMRDELSRARANERAAEQSKHELVASLSHDIKTPVSSIKAAAELMEINANEDQVPKLKAIQDKASQIQNLVSDLFLATLEELDSLSVNTIPTASNQLAEIIQAADYQSLASIIQLPDCLVLADPGRMAQVIDNIIANSYKYAATRIDITAEIDGNDYVMTFRDYGDGVLEEELPRLCTKYFRGKAAEGKKGYGLGLFIAHNLITSMGGQLECMNEKPGFAVRIWLRIDS